jgi:Zn-dependent metalloprotease
MLAAVLVVLSVLLQATSAQEMTSTHINKRTKVVQVHIDASHMQGESTAALTLPLRADDFMKKYATEEFSVSSEELRLAKVLPLSNTGNAAYKYQQYAGGLRIVGAELIIVENQKHGVLQAKSHSLMTNAADLAASALRISIAPVEAVTLLQQYMTSKYGSKKQFNMDISSKEMVFYQGHEGKELETPVEAYELKGSSVLDIGESNYGVVYTAYIDTKTGAVIDYTARGEPSEEDQKVKKVETAKANTKESRSLRGRETSKTILATTGGFLNFDDFGTASEFIVYDCLGQASCPSNPAIMWRSSTGTWPTNDEEINKAVAVSAQFVRMMRAISNQEWVTFGITARQQKIYLHIDMVNAYYNGNGIYFGQELVVDDVIAHEWSHGYCDYSSNLVYYSQSGALNEANSDIYGETIDILNSQEVGTSIGDSDMIRMDSPRRMVQECNIDNWQYQDETGNDPSRWWIVGEDVERNTLGAIRDMYKPECFGHPGSMDSDDFYCGEKVR